MSRDHGVSREDRESRMPSTDARRYWLDAYLFRNLGDDLMVTELVTQNPETIFYCPKLHDWNNSAFRNFQNLRPITSWKQMSICILGIDGVVILGGSMFMDRRGVPWRAHLRHRAAYLRRLALAFLMRIRGRDFDIIGCNIGPIETRVGGFIFRSIFRAATFITVRDSVSATQLSNLGCKQFLLAPDMVFSLVHCSSSAAPSADRSLVLGISVIALPNQEHQKTYLDQIAHLVQQVLKRKPEVEVRLLGFQDTLHDDGIAIDAVMARIDPDERVHKVMYRGDIPNFLAMLRTCSYIVGTRFHSVILAIAIGLPCSVISYSRKTDQTLDDLGWPGQIHHSDPLSLTAVEAILSEIEHPFIFRPNVAEASYHAKTIGLRDADLLGDCWTIR